MCVLLAALACARAETDEAQQIASALRDMWHMFVRMNPWPVRVYKSNQALCDALALVSMYVVVAMTTVALCYWSCVCAHTGWRRWRPAVAAKHKAE